MRGIRRKEKEIKDREELIAILEDAEYITLAMCSHNQPYLVTLNHGFDREKNCIYFHCAQEGQKIDILKENDRIWGQALIDIGYVQGLCDHLYATTHFGGRVTFVTDYEEKKHALIVMIKSLERDPKKVIQDQLTRDSILNVGIGRIDIETMSGKKAEKAMVSM
jgi:nitroimidazol reductase NimA-like FMN-containing flavoprotein (pyridoxamine 5'-phosphate oxidase superfamily)